MKKLTIKEQKLVNAKAKGKPHHEAHKEAGYAPTTKKAAVVNTSKVLSKPHVKEALEAALSRQGITVDKIAQRVAEGMDAEKVTIVGNGDQAMAEITPDHSIRLKATGMAANFMGLGKEQGVAPNQFIQVIKEQTNKYV